VPQASQLHGWAFGEDQARFVVTTANHSALIAAAKDAGVEITKIGKVSASGELKFGASDAISVSELGVVFEATIPALMAG
jgi:phosphoribosylformylglycinamidine synthase